MKTISKNCKYYATPAWQGLCYILVFLEVTIKRNAH